MLILPEAIQTMLNAFMAVFAKKEDIPKELPESDILEWLTEEKIVEPVVTNSGAFYTANDNKIYIL